MISETTPLNQWSQEDLVKLAAALETVAEISKRPDYAEFAERVVPVIKAALKDVIWEENRILNYKAI